MMSRRSPEGMMTLLFTDVKSLARYLLWVLIIGLSVGNRFSVGGGSLFLCVLVSWLLTIYLSTVSPDPLTVPRVSETRGHR